MVAELRTEFLFEIRYEFDALQVVGATPRGFRQILPIRQGTFTGPKLKGHILPGGTGWLLRRTDGVRESEARVCLQTDDEHLI